MIANKYNIIEKIGEGAFGAVYKGQNIRTKEYVAIKFEEKTNEMRSLKNEAKIYQYLASTGSNKFPLLKWFGTYGENRYLVLELLGPSLSSLGTISLKNAFEIGVQMILLLQSLHEKYLLHRDIKPANFLFGLNNKFNKLHLIDFGFCKRYNYDGIHIEEKCLNKIVGSPNFVSLNVHNLVEPSRRDDLESCIYIILTLIYGDLPWTTSELDLNTIYLLKKQIISKNIPNIIKTALNYVRSLAFEEDPNYEYLIRLFT
jgi:serine/threonine protein kinase